MEEQKPPENTSDKSITSNTNNASITARNTPAEIAHSKIRPEFDDDDDDQQTEKKPRKKAFSNRCGSFKLEPEEITELCLQYLHGKSMAEIAKEYRLSASTVARYISRNNEFMERAKQDLMSECLADAIRAGYHITDDKLAAASAAQLNTIRREAIYTYTMLTQGKLPGNDAPNLAKVILETAQILSSLPQNVTPQNEKVIDIPATIEEDKKVT